MFGTEAGSKPNDSWVAPVTAATKMAINVEP
jgi:hypothetical protein